MPHDTLYERSEWEISFVGFRETSSCFGCIFSSVFLHMNINVLIDLLCVLSSCTKSATPCLVKDSEKRGMHCGCFWAKTVRSRSEKSRKVSSNIPSVIDFFASKWLHFHQKSHMVCCSVSYLFLTPPAIPCLDGSPGDGTMQSISLGQSLQREDGEILDARRKKKSEPKNNFQFI